MLTKNEKRVNMKLDDLEVVGGNVCHVYFILLLHNDHLQLLLLFILAFTQICLTAVANLSINHPDKRLFSKDKVTVEKLMNSKNT